MIARSPTLERPATRPVTIMRTIIGLAPSNRNLTNRETFMASCSGVRHLTDCGKTILEYENDAW